MKGFEFFDVGEQTSDVAVDVATLCQRANK